MIFILIFGGGLVLIIALTVFLILFSINRTPRAEATALAEGVTVTEFATLPGDDAYPAAIAAAPDGTLYTASYANGTVWRIDATGEASAIDGTEEAFGAVTGLSVGPDGALYVLDRITFNPRSAGGMLWRVDADGGIVEIGPLSNEEGFVSPDDVTVDAAGNVYVSDRGLREVWRYTPEGASAFFWEPTEEGTDGVTPIPTGLAYDPNTDTLLVTDSELSTVYRVPLTGGESTILYREGAPTQGLDPSSFDGITVAPDGTIYVAAFGSRQVVRVNVETESLSALAGNFRGSSDVAYQDGALYVTNFDQRSLVLPGIEPQLPFGIDVVLLNDESG